MLQCVAVRCSSSTDLNSLRQPVRYLWTSVLQCIVAVYCCSVLRFHVLQRVAACCSALQCVAVCYELRLCSLCSVLQCIACCALVSCVLQRVVCCNVLCVAMCCVLQRVVCCNVLCVAD